MKIATEIGWGQKKGGIRRVALKLLEAMARLRPDHDYVVLSNVKHESLSGPSIQQVQPEIPAFIPGLVWDQFIFPHLWVPKVCKKIKPDIIHHTSNMASFWGQIPSVVTIHDMSPFVVPEMFRMDHLVYQNFRRVFINLLFLFQFLYLLCKK